MKQAVFTMTEYLTFMDVLNNLKEDGELSLPEAIIIEAFEEAMNRPVVITITVE